MSLRYLGGYVSSAYNPLAANVGPGTNVAQTQGMFTTQSAFESVAANQWCTDPNFKNTTLLLQADNVANASQNNTFLDSSTNNYPITRTGTQTQGSFSPYSQPNGYWSNYFDGAGDYLTIPTSAALNVSTGNFTIEFWINPNGNNNYGIFKLVGTGTTSNGPTFTSAKKFAWWKDGSSEILLSTTIAEYGSWYHVAYVRSGTSFKLYVNGISESTVTNSDSFNFSGWSIGRGYYDNQMQGFLSNFRLTNSAVYTANFTPPTAPLTTTVPSGTVQLLTCQSNRFKDNSTNNFTLTVNGNPAVQLFTPSTPQYAYSPAVTGGSTYKIRTDYLATISSASLITFTGDFTLEAWAYSTVTTTGDWGLMDARNTGGTAQNWVWNITGYSNGFLLNFYTAGTNRQGATRIPANAWNHLAVVRTGTTLKYYINGVVDPNTFTISGTINGSSGINVFLTNNKDYAASAEFGSQGYIVDLRVVNGTAVYTANFTPPTAPLTVITNTSLLLKNTNVGIVDGSQKNNLETANNAQVSTSVKKFGSGSMAFDGTGDWVIAPNSLDLQMRTGNFTVEGWFYLSALGTARGLVSKGTATTGWSVNITSGNFLQASYTATNLTGTVPILINTWYHFAMVRAGSAVGNIKIYLNGALQASSATAITTDFSQTEVLYVGANRVAGDPMLGYMDDVRITKAARYLDSFTPPQIAFARQ